MNNQFFEYNTKKTGAQKWANTGQKFARARMRSIAAQKTVPAQRYGPRRK